jgi:hypothetical protein
MSVLAESKLSLVAAIMLVASTAFAQQPGTSSADAAFTRGRELLKAGKYADACVEFEHSQKLDPALGTEFNIAQCSEKTGKLARALEMYRDLAARDTKADRKKEAVEAIPKIEARVPHLQVKVPTPPAGFTLTIEPINSGLPPKALEVNKLIEIDFGEYELVARAPGAADWRQNVRIDTEAKTTTIEPPFGAKPVTPPVDPNAGKNTNETTTGTESLEEPVDAPSEPPKSKRKLYGIIGMGVGGAALATGVVFGVMAKGKWSDAKDVCGGTTCTNQMDLDKANDLRDQAKSKATLSTIFVGVGVGAAAAGVVLFVTAPKDQERSTQVTAHPIENGGGITFSGSF